MKLNAGPVETKVVAATAVPFTVGAIFAAAQFYHWFSPPPVGVTASIVTVLTGLAGWFARHTSRPDLTKPTQRALFAMADALGAEVRLPLANAIVTAGPKQPPATTTGPAAP